MLSRLPALRAAAAAALGEERWADWSSEPLLPAAVQACASPPPMLDTLRAAFLSLQWDLPARPAEEEDEAEPKSAAAPDSTEAAPACPREVRMLPPTDLAGALHAAVVPLLTIRGVPPSLPALVCALHMARQGAGEASLRFALTCAQAAAAGSGVAAAMSAGACVDEPAAWAALEWSAASPIDAVLRANLRRAWRTCAAAQATVLKPVHAVADVEVDEGEQGEGEAKGEPGEPEEPEGTPLIGCKAVEELIEALRADALLARVWMQE